MDINHFGGKGVKRITFEIRRATIRNEISSALYVLALRRTELFPFHGTDLTVEGFPRSANSYVVASLKVSNPHLRCASHLHGTGSLKASLRKNIPTVVLYRDPLDAVASLAVREGFPVGPSLRWYADFYRWAHLHSSDIILASFEEATGSLSSLYDRISARSGLNLHAPPSGADRRNIEEVVKAGERRFSGTVDDSKVSLPSLPRTALLSTVKQAMERDPRLVSAIRAARDIYAELRCAQQ